MVTWKRPLTFTAFTIALLILAASLLPNVLLRVRLLSQHLLPSAAIPLAVNRQHTNTTANMASVNDHQYLEHEFYVALLAVQRASILTKSVFHNQDLRGEKGQEVRETVWNLVRQTRLENAEYEGILGGSVKSADAMLDLIDKGDSQGGGKGRIWAIDPIDGTKGFLRGGQYAVCLALIIDGDVKVGVLGCPNLPISDSEPLTEGIGKDASDEEGKFGVVFAAKEGDGAVSCPLSKRGDLKMDEINMNPLENVADATFCESVEAGHSSQGDAAAIAKKLGITKPSVRMDSQAKYGSIARGAGDLYLRLPVRADYVEKIWDHAAGELIVREAGGMVTDIEGNRLNFKLGRTLKENKGVIAAPKNLHGKVIEAVKDVLGAKQ